MRLLKCISLVALIFLSFISSSFANVQIQTAKNFAAVSKIIQNAVKQSGASHVLVAFDCDDTLLTMPQGLGGVGWYHWQKRLFKQYKKTGKFNSALVSHRSQGIDEIDRVVFALSYMNPTDTNIPGTLKRFAKKGVSMMIATARSPLASNATELQLKQAGFTNKPNHLIFASSAPKTQTGVPGYGGVFYPATLSTKRPLFYMNGIYYMNEQNKGKTLIDLFKKMNLKGKTSLIFVDDQMGNITDVATAMRHYPALKNVVSVHYTKEHAKQQSFLSDAHGEQQKATKAWKDLSGAIKRHTPKNQLPH